MVPTVIAGTVGAGAHWVTPHNSIGLSNPAGQDPSYSTAELYKGKVQLHPQTNPNDPLYARFGLQPPDSRGSSVSGAKMFSSGDTNNV